MKWYYVDISYACFAIGTLDGTVIESAPISAWMKGKKLSDIKPWLITKHARVIELK